MTDRARTADIVAGYLATFAIFVSALAIAYRPVRLAPIAMLIVLAATPLAGERSERLLRFAVWATVVGWLGGMTVAVVTESPLW